MSKTVALVGFQDQGNLGIGYLASSLKAAGFEARVFDVGSPPDRLVTEIVAVDPVIVGFSLIFQYYLDRFGDLAGRLRQAGCQCHMTIGGHFATLCSDETLRAIPELNSVVRGEGEETLVQLAQRLAAGESWDDLEGLAYRRNGRVHKTAPRPLLADLDALPPPARDCRFERVLGWSSAPLLASRGCSRRCSFCSIHNFYRASPGPSVRLRNPVSVVGEMAGLHREHGVRIFLFQDDDFPVAGRRGRAWARQLVTELGQHGLAGRILWKISCRPDEIEPELFAEMRDAGLYLVYLGLESGNERGLATLNKHTSVSQNLVASRLLSELGILMECGFMMFDPSSDLTTIRQNLAFLRELLAGGAGAAVFCRMLPYGGTAIAESLRAAGRLRGGVLEPDYTFADDRVSHLYRSLRPALDLWINGLHAVSPQLNWALHEVSLMKRLFRPLEGLPEYERQLHGLVAAANEQLFGLVERAVEAAASEARHSDDTNELLREASSVITELLQLRNSFVGVNQDRMVAVLAAAAGETC